MQAWPSAQTRQERSTGVRRTLRKSQQFGPYRLASSLRADFAFLRYKAVADRWHCSDQTRHRELKLPRGIHQAGVRNHPTEHRSRYIRTRLYARSARADCVQRRGSVRHGQRHASKARCLFYRRHRRQQSAWYRAWDRSFSEMMSARKISLSGRTGEPSLARPPCFNQVPPPGQVV